MVSDPRSSTGLSTDTPLVINWKFSRSDRRIASEGATPLVRTSVNPREFSHRKTLLSVGWRRAAHTTRT